MASYSTIPATEDLGLTAAAPPKNTLGRKGLATLAALCFASGVAGYGKYDLVGVNCEDGTSAEGDILFTIYPKYKLSY